MFREEIMNQYQTFDLNFSKVKAKKMECRLRHLNIEHVSTTLLYQ